ncbi:MAG: cobyric acid synthase [Treponema sp.]|nr:cobyric acid synthase [Treponema sp.]
MNKHGGAARISNSIDFSANINPLGLHPAAQQALASLVLDSENFSRYPDAEASSLKALLARFWNCDSASVVCGAGAADILYTLVSLSGGAKAVIVEPAFTEYEAAAKAAGCQIAHFLLKESADFAFTEDDLRRLPEVLRGAGLLFLAHPANPTGVTLSFEMLSAVASLCEQTGTLFVLDACFCQFSPDAETVVRRLLGSSARFPHLVVVNAFTKYYGMAGLRLGYAIFSDSALASRFCERQRPWAVSSESVRCGEAVLEAELSAQAAPAECDQPQECALPPTECDLSQARAAEQEGCGAGEALAEPGTRSAPEACPARWTESKKTARSDWAEKTLACITGERNRMYSALQRLSLRCIKGNANFILFQCAADLSSFTAPDSLVVIRQCADFYGLDASWYRIAVKTPQENTVLLNALSKALSFDVTFPESKTGPLDAPGKKKARVIMVQGTMSNAGKSLLVAALCRIFAQDGYRAAPFKSQNMALNSGVTEDGLEMGRAQIMQAEAAGILPDVSMNPILLKPCSDKGSQVIVNGEVRGVMSARDYFAFRKKLIPEILAAYRRLQDEYDVIVIEGAGSPAEINLKKDDIVNMGLAELVDAPVLLAGDIDRGGVFASLYGTAALLPQSERKRIKGFIINKFRGEVSLLQDGLEQIHALTGIPVLGVVPYIPNLRIDDEDSLSERLENVEKQETCLHIVALRFPYVSNFTDLAAFDRLPFVQVSYCESMEEYGECVSVSGEPDMLVLPGTKNTVQTLDWLRQTGFDRLVIRKARSALPVVGLCGGFQLLGRCLHDPEGNEGGFPRNEIAGLGLLPVETVFSVSKTRRQVHTSFQKTDGVYGCLSGCAVSGYEIHHGVTTGLEEQAVGCINGSVLGTYVHGFFDEEEICRAFVQLLCARKGIAVPAFSEYAASRNQEYDRLAAVVRESLDMEALYKILSCDTMPV